jgi:hypothetical protein
MSSTQPDYIYHVKVRYFLHMRFRVETLYYQMAVLNSKDPKTAVDKGKLFKNFDSKYFHEFGTIYQTLVLVTNIILSTWVTIC